MKRCFYSFVLAGVFSAVIFLSPCFSQKVDIEVKTKSYGGVVAPRHAAAIWIQTPQKKLVNTIDVWSYGYNFCLKNWRTVTDLRDTGAFDGITAATIEDHSKAIQVTWDCKDTAGSLVPNGTYEFCAEMTESEYYWINGEEYLGRYAKGTIAIDNQPKVVYGDTTDTCFSGFKATYDPSIGIKPLEKKPAHDQSLSYLYNPLLQKVTIRLNVKNALSAVLRIYNLKGELLKTAHMNKGLFCWDLRGGSGTRVGPGVYMFEVRAADTGRRLSSACSITLSW